MNYDYLDRIVTRDEAWFPREKLRMVRELSDYIGRNIPSFWKLLAGADIPVILNLAKLTPKKESEK